MMLPCNMPPRGSGTPGPARYPTASSHEDTTELIDASAAANALHKSSAPACEHSVEGSAASSTPASMGSPPGNYYHRQCSTTPPLKALLAEPFVAPTPEEQRCALTGTVLLTSSDLPHPSTHVSSSTSKFAWATPKESVRRVHSAPPLRLSATLSSARLHVGIAPQASGSNAISKVSTSAPSTPSTHRPTSKMRRWSSSTLTSPLHSGVCMRASPLATVCDQHVEAHGRCDAPSHAPLSIHPTFSSTSSTEATPVSSGTRFGRSVDEASGRVNAHCIGTVAASSVAVSAAPGLFRTLPRPTTALSGSLVGFGGVRSCSCSTPSGSASNLKDRHSSGSGICGMASEWSLLRPFGASSFDRDEVGAEVCDSEASGAAINSVTVEVLHRGDGTSLREGQCSRLRSGRSSSTFVSGGLGGCAANASGVSAAATASGAAVAHHANAESGSSGGAVLHGAGCSLGRRLFSSLTSQRGGAAPAPSPGIFQSGLFLSVDEGDASRASAMDVPMTPQSFSTMLLARESGEGAQHTVGAGNVASAVTTTHGDHSYPLTVPEGVDAPLEQSSQQLTVVSGVGEGGWGRGEVAADGIEEWFVDGGSRGSHGTGTTGTTSTSGIWLPPGLVAGTGSVGLMLRRRHITPLSSLQLLSGGNQLEMPISGVDVDEIPFTPTNLSALPNPPPPRSARRRRQGCLSSEGSGTSRVDVETGVIETDMLERALAVSKDGARAYEIVNEKYVMYAYELGRGSYSTVRLCYNLRDGHFYALKVLDCVRLKRRQLGSEASLCKIDQEIAMMKQVQHKNIIALHEVIRDSSMRYVYLVLELAESREVLSMRDNGDVLPRGDNGAVKAYLESTTREIVKGLLHALMYAHYLGVAHRDIKPSNILRTADGTVKLCDFGVSVLVGEVPMKLSREGSVAFLAPELLLSSEVDVSRFVTPADSFLGNTRNRIKLHTLDDDTVASTASTARMTVTSATDVTNATEMVSSGGSASPTKEAIKSSQCLTSSLADAAVQSSARAASLHGPRRGTASFSARDADDGCRVGAVHSASLQTSSLTLRRPSKPAYSAAIVMDAADPSAGDATAVAPLESASSPSTQAAHQQGFPFLAVDHEHVDLFKADVFALGVTVYTMLIGQLPWRASNAASQHAAILAEPDPFLRLYMAAYGDAYRPPAQVQDVCLPSCDKLVRDALPASSRAATSASSSAGRSEGHGKANAEMTRGPRAIAAERDNPAAPTPAPAASFPCKWRRSSSTGTSGDGSKSKHTKCRLTVTRLAAATHSHLDSATQSNCCSAQSASDHNIASTRLPRTVNPLLTVKGTTCESHVSNELAEPRPDDDDSSASFATFMPPMPPRQQQRQQLPQRRPSGCLFLGSIPVKLTTAADTATTPQTQVATMRRRGGSDELSGQEIPHMNITTPSMWPRTSASTVLLLRAAAQSRSGPEMQGLHSLSIAGSEYVSWELRAAAMSCTAGPSSPRSRRSTATTPSSNHRSDFLAVYSSEGGKTDEPEMSRGVGDGTVEAEQWIRHSPGGGLLRTVLSTVVSTTRPHTDNADSSDFTDASRDDENVATGSDDGSSTAVSCSAETSTTSLRSSDDDEEIESCENIYERLFELEQPGRAYLVTEHTPLPAVPGSSGEISGDAVDFVRACLCLDPTERRTVFELFRHPWIRGGESAAEAERSTALDPPRRCSSATEKRRRRKSLHPTLNGTPYASMTEPAIV